MIGEQLLHRVMRNLKKKSFQSSISRSSVARFVCLPVTFCHTHMHMQTWKLFSWKQTCAQSCYVFGPLFVMLFNYVFFSPRFCGTAHTHTLSFTPSFIVSLILFQCHSPSVFLSSRSVDSETISRSLSHTALFAVMLNAPNQRWVNPVYSRYM